MPSPLPSPRPLLGSDFLEESGGRFGDRHFAALPPGHGVRGYSYGLGQGHLSPIKLASESSNFLASHCYTQRIARPAKKSSGLAGARRQKALHFFNFKAHVVPEFDRGQIPHPSLFPNPRFRDSKELGEIGCAQKGAA